MVYIIIWLAIFIAVEVITFFVYFQSTGFVVTKYELTTDKKLNKELNIVMLSDLHDTDTGNNNEDLIKEIDKIHPDFILLAGDMITSYMQPKYNSEVTFDFLKKLSSKYEVYYGLGNHEQRYLSEPEKFKGKFEQLEQYVKSLNIHFLNNTHVDIDKLNLSIWGVNIPIENYRRVVTKDLTRGFVKASLGDNDPGKINILLAHNPDFFEEYVNWNPDFVCSGHVHGGIVRIPGLGGVLSPQLKLFPKYDWGIYKKDKTTMILSCGIGWHSIPIRIFNKGELVNLIIKSNV